MPKEPVDAAAQPTPLLDSAAALEAMATRLENRMQRQGEVEILSSRKATLQQLSERLAPLVSARSVLAAAEDASTRLEVNAALKRLGTEATRLLANATRIEHEVVANPKTLQKQKVFDGLAGEKAKDDKLKPIEAATWTAWHAFVGSNEVTGPERVLEGYATLSEAGESLRAIRDELGELRDSLPTSAEDLARALELRRERSAQLDSLKGKGLDDEIVSFLARSIEGVSLRELLESPKIVKWLKAQNAMDEFLVKASATGGNR